MDTKIRSWVKSIVWRVVGIVLLGAISYLITGNWKEMTIITILFHGIRVIMYYFHERLWECIPWGKLRHPLGDLPVNKELTPEHKEMIRRRLQELGYIQ